MSTNRNGELWRVVAIPYGAATAGLAAVLAASLTYLNGQNQLHQAQAALEHAQDEANRRNEQARSELDHTKADADRRYDADLIRGLRARFTTATAQLADSTTTIQQAGAYALASLADDWLTRTNIQEAQVCIDVLSTYLRTHHLDNKSPETYDHTTPPPDQSVRDTIVRIIRNHLIGHPIGQSWSNLTYDLSNAHLHNIDFSHTRWTADKGANFNGAIFTATTEFAMAEFGLEARFVGATFSNRASFIGATFGDQARFELATFGDIARFQQAKFGDLVRFRLTTFGERASFAGATFGGRERFSGARFGDRAEFGGATFGDDANFDGTTFGGRARFANATFGKRAGFERATFGDGAIFETSFADGARFSEATFGAKPSRRPEAVAPEHWPLADDPQPSTGT